MRSTVFGRPMRYVVHQRIQLARLDIRVALQIVAGRKQRVGIPALVSTESKVVRPEIPVALEIRVGLRIEIQREERIAWK